LGYTFFEYLFFTLIISYHIKSPRSKKIIEILSLLFLLYLVFYMLTGSVKRLDSIPIGIETVLIISYIFLFFREFLKSLINGFVYSHFIFWVSIGILIYLGGSFFFFILINNLTTEQISIFGIFTYLTEIIKNIFFVVSLFVFSNSSTTIKTSNQPKRQTM
jgi:hypothetical protein